MPIVYDESLHPRGPDGKYIDKQSMQEAAHDLSDGGSYSSDKYNRLEKHVGPEQTLALNRAVWHYHDEHRAKKLADSPAATAPERLSDTLHAGHTSPDFHAVLHDETKQQLAKDLAEMPVHEIRKVLKRSGITLDTPDPVRKLHNQVVQTVKKRQEELIDKVSGKDYTGYGDTPDERVHNALSFDADDDLDEIDGDTEDAMTSDLQAMDKPTLFKIASEFRDGNGRTKSELGDLVQDQAESRGWHRDKDAETAAEFTETYYDHDGVTDRVGELFGLAEYGEDTLQHLDEDTKAAVVQDIAAMPVEDLWDLLQDDSSIVDEPTGLQLLDLGMAKKKSPEDRPIEDDNTSDMLLIHKDHLKNAGLENIAKAIPQLHALLDDDHMLIHRDDLPGFLNENHYDDLGANHTNDAMLFDAVASQPLIGADDAPMSARNYGSTSQGAKIEDDWNPNAKHVYKRLSEDWYIQKLSSADADANDTPFRLIPASKAPPMTRLPIAYWQGLDAHDFGADSEQVAKSEQRKDKHSEDGKAELGRYEAQKTRLGNAKKTFNTLNARAAHTNDKITSDDHLNQRLSDALKPQHSIPDALELNAAMASLADVSHDHEDDDTDWGYQHDGYDNEGGIGALADSLDDASIGHEAHNEAFKEHVDSRAAVTREKSREFRGRAMAAAEQAQAALRDYNGTADTTAVQEYLDRLSGALMRPRRRS